MGWRRSWRRLLFNDPATTSLADAPGFQELIAALESDMDRQRALAYELLDVDS